MTPTLTSLAQLADQYCSDKGFSVLNAHGYVRVYEALLGKARLQPLRLLEIGLLHPVLHAANRDPHTGGFSKAPSLQMWLDYLPQSQVFGIDIEDFSAWQHPRAQIFRADQSNRSSLVAAARAMGGKFDVIIDDGSHASHHQQITLAALFPFLNAGGLYIVEDLHYQPADLEMPGLTKTRTLLQGLQRREIQGAASVWTAHELAMLERSIQSIFFFDSLDRDRPNVFETRDALAVLQKTQLL